MSSWSKGKTARRVVFYGDFSGAPNRPIGARSRFVKAKSLSVLTIVCFTAFLLAAPFLNAQIHPQPLTGKYYNGTMVWDGITRYYRVYVPSGLPANPALLVMLHATNLNPGTSPPTRVNYGWQTFADTYKFILVQPTSTYNSKSGQWNWNAYYLSEAFTAAEVGTCTVPPATDCPDDAGFLRNLIVILTAQYSVNPKQVFVAGMSSGAMMAERVGVELSDLVAAIIPASGQIVDSPLFPSRCRSRRWSRFPCRSGKEPRIAFYRPATMAQHCIRGTRSTWPLWTKPLITGLRKMPVPRSRTMSHCAKTELLTQVLPAMTLQAAGTTLRCSSSGKKSWRIHGRRRITPHGGSFRLPERP